MFFCVQNTPTEKKLWFPRKNNSSKNELVHLKPVNNDEVAIIRKLREESALYWTRTSDPRPVKAML